MILKLLTWAKQKLATPIIMSDDTGDRQAGYG